MKVINREVLLHRAENDLTDQIVEWLNAKDTAESNSAE